MDIFLGMYSETKNFIDSVSSNGFLADDVKPLPDRMLIYQ